MQVANGSSAIIYLTDDEKYEYHEDADEEDYDEDQDHLEDGDEDDDNDDKSDDGRYGRSTASSQYFLQLAGYLGPFLLCYIYIVFCFIFYWKVVYIQEYYGWLPWSVSIVLYVYSILFSFLL